MSVSVAAAQPLPYQGNAKSLGAVTCANSLCHGSITKWKDSPILQNEYVTWSRVDKHATKAYQVLFEERSKRITRNLGLKEPPHQAKLCVDCHAHNPRPGLRGERFRVDDGVSCEACHGPAEKWIERHVAAGATHAGNLASGLYPTSEPLAQARLCLSCHFGNRDKFVTHRIMGAGHPRISFELETFAQTQPPHFVIDADWQQRKGEWDGVRVWAAGQAIAAAELLDVLLDPKRSRDGLFPELVVFDCHACHHPMSERRWSPRQGIGPGRIRLNDANFLMLRQIARVVLSGPEARDFEERVLKLHRAVAGEGGEALDEARVVRSAVDALAKRIAARRFGNEELRAMLAGLVEDGLQGAYRDYAGAEQATMAIGSLLDFLGKRGGLANPRAANAALDQLHRAVRDDEKFRPDQFSSALARLRADVLR